MIRAEGATWRAALAAAGGARGGSVTVGVLDGGHVGHRAVVDRLKIAPPAVVVTFDRHPMYLLGRHPDREERAIRGAESGVGSAPLDPPGAPPEIEALPARLARLEAWGVAAAVVLPLTEELLATEAEAFVEAVAASLGPRAFVCGPGFRFGAGRRGDAATLRAAGRRLGFDVIEVPAVDVGGAPASSTRLRAALAAGDLEAAAALCGRPFSVIGVVVGGAGRGRSLGAPTANVDPPPGPAMAGGVYAVRFGPVGRADLPGVANLGRRPTFGGGPRTLEVHVIDGDAPAPGEAVETAFVRRIRDEMRFETPAALADRIARDIETARRILC